MKRVYVLKSSRLFLLLATVFLVFIGCEKEEKNEAIQLPPESSFIMDVSMFDASAKSTNGMDLSGTKVNFGMAYLATLYWNTVISVTMAVPVASFKSAFNYNAERVTDDKWKWSYDVTVQNAKYSADLFGEVLDNGTISWKMYVSKENGFTDFLWYEGECNVQRTQGNWILYESPLNNVQLLNINWNYSWENKTGDIKYTYVKEGANFNNYIHYGVTTDVDYNVFYNLYGSSENNLVQLKYNSITHEGKIIDKNNAQYCWDTQFFDVTCD